MLVLVIGLFVILTVEFCLFRVLPDNPAQLAVPHRPFNPSLVPAEYADWYENAVSELYEPLHVQYFQFIGDMLTGDFGFSHASQSEISDTIYSAMWKTVILFGASLFLSLVVGSMLGRAISRIKAYVSKQVVSIAILSLFSLSVMVWQWLFIRFVAIEWGLLPIGGSARYGSSGVALDHLILPVASIFMASVGAFILCIRDGHLRAAEALPQQQPSLREGLFAAMPNMQFMVGASILFVAAVEVWFNFPGLAWYLVNALFNSDYFMLQATFFLLAIIVFATNYVMETVVTLMRHGRRLDLFLHEEEHPVIMAGADARADRVVSLFSEIVPALKQVSKDYLKSPIGVVSLAVFAAIVVLAAVGPSFTPDEFNPYEIGSSSELFLDGARAPVTIALLACLVALLVGTVLGIIAGLSRPYADGVVIGIMHGLIAIQFTGFIIFLLYTRSYRDYFNAAVACSVPAMALVALLSFHGFVSARNRVAAGPRGGSACVKLARSAPAVSSWAVSGLKYAMPLTVMVVLVSDYWGLTRFSSWGYAFNVAVQYDEWEYILPPVIGSCLLIGSIFLVLDTIERVIRTRFSELV